MRRLVPCLVMLTACSVLEEAEDSESAAKSACVSDDAIRYQSRDEAIGAWLRGSGSDANKSKWIAKIAGDAKVVAFGEPDHGFHEFGERRNEIFKTLVEKKKFRAITFESGLIEAKLVDDYVTDVDGKRGLALERVLSEGFTHGMGELCEEKEGKRVCRIYDEVADLVEWVRAQNIEAAKSGKPLLRWGGIDLSVVGDTLSLPVGKLAAFYASVGEPQKIERLVALSAKASELTDFIANGLMAQKQAHIDPDHLDAITSLSYDQIEPAEAQTIRNDLAAARADLTSQRATYAAKLGEKGTDEVDWALQLVSAAEQIQRDLEHRLTVGVPYGPMGGREGSFEYIQKLLTRAKRPMPPMRRVTFLRASADGTPPVYSPEQLALYQEARKSREEHLAKNVELLVNRFGKTFVFAATSHIQKARSLKDSGEGFAAGQFLAETYGKDFVVIGGTASEYEALPLTGDPAKDAIIATITKQRLEEAARPDSIERPFELTGTLGLVVDLREDPCKRPDWAQSWLSRPLLTWTGPAKFQAVAKDNYDVILWVRRATLGQTR